MITEFTNKIFFHLSDGCAHQTLCMHVRPGNRDVKHGQLNKMGCETERRGRLVVRGDGIKGYFCH